MAYTETKSVGLFSRLGSSFRGIGVGIVLIIAGTCLLWWNEGNFVATQDALNEAQGVTQELGDVNTLNTSLNGKLVHATGPANTTDVLRDPIFNISTTAIRLSRTVEFYQWVENSHSETRQKLGGGEETVTTYTYEQKWVNRPVNSSSFRDPVAVRNNANTILMTLENTAIQATNVSFGAYRLPDSLIGSISGATSLEAVLPEETLAALNRQLTAPAAPSTQTADEEDPWQAAFGLSGAGTGSSTSASMVHTSGNTVYLGQTPATPRVGDVRVTFREVRPATVSIIAKLNGSTFESYRASNGKTISMLQMGETSLDNMYGDSHSSNSTMTWILRVVGIFLIIIGLKMIVAPLQVIASVIPFLGNIVGAGTGIVCTLLGLAWSLVVIAIAWLRFRPLVACIAIIIAIAFAVLLYLRGRSRNAAKA